MKKLLLFLLFTTTLIAQNDSIPKEPIRELTSEDFFTDVDIALIDSLLIERKFQSPLYDKVQYVINDLDIRGTSKTVLSTELLKERLALINATTPFNLAHNPSLESVINGYLKHRSKYYPALMAKAQYYFPMFEQYLDQYNIPLEMKYLAIVESTLNPKARSRVGATGLWQFMYATGKQFKLSVNSYVDERQDPVKSTIAACEYLSQLHRLFGDWDLALAAYNSGPGNVLKAIKRSGGHKNYWNLRPFLPRETAGYVPAFYATMYIFAYASEHNIYPDAPQIFNFQTDTVRVKKTITFNNITEKTGIDSELLTFLNPQYKLDIIPFIKDKNYAVRLPRKKTFAYLEKEQEIYALAEADNSKREKPLPTYFESDRGTRYRVKNGDFLGKIAKKFGVRVSDIKRWNNLRSNKLKIGQRLTIHPKNKRASTSLKKKQKTSLPIGSYEKYIVQNEDSLWMISENLLQVSIDQVKNGTIFGVINNLDPKDTGYYRNSFFIST